MNNIRAFALLLSSFCLSLFSYAQNSENWGLERCLEYALQNNLRLQQAGLGLNQAETNLRQARHNRYPAFNGSFSVGNNFGFSIDPITDANIASGSQSFSTGIGGSVTLFDGFRLKNTIRQSEVDLLASRTDVKDNENLLMLNVATAYLQILSDLETLESARLQVESTREQRDRTAKLVEAGSLAQADLLQLESQIATEELTVVNAENTLEISYLNLRRTMNLPPEEPLTIERPQLADPTEESLSTMGEIIDYAVQNQPSVQAADMRVQSAEIGEELARSAYYPGVNLSGRLGTGFTTAFKNPVTEEIIPLPEQLSTAFGGGLTFGVNIPIYSRGQIKTNEELARIGIRNAQLNASLARQDIEQTIQQAYVDVKNAYSSYTAIQRQIEALELTFDNTEKQFNLGLVNSVDYLLAKNNLNRARFDLVRTKYIYIFRKKVLDFYQGKPIGF